MSKLWKWIGVDSWLDTLETKIEGAEPGVDYDRLRVLDQIVSRPWRYEDEIRLTDQTGLTWGQAQTELQKSVVPLLNEIERLQKKLNRRSKTISNLILGEDKS